jgi:hypothetical protein
MDNSLNPELLENLCGLLHALIYRFPTTIPLVADQLDILIEISTDSNPISPVNNKRRSENLCFKSLSLLSDLLLCADFPLFLPNEFFLFLVNFLSNRNEISEEIFEISLEILCEWSLKEENFLDKKENLISWILFLKQYAVDLNRSQETSEKIIFISQKLSKNSIPHSEGKKYLDEICSKLINDGE